DLAPLDESVGGPPSQRGAPGEPDLGDRPPAAPTVARLEQADVAHSLAVRELPVDQLGADQGLAGPRLERVEVEVPAAQPHTLAVELGDATGADEDPAPLAGRDEADHAWRPPGAAGDDDDVLDLADLGPARVEQGQPHHPEGVDQLPCHQRAGYPWAVR